MTVVNLQRKKNLPAGRGIAWWIDWSVNDWPIAALSAPIIQTIDSGAKLLLSGVRFPLHLLAFENWFESMLNSERLIRINWQTDTHARTHTRRSTENCFTSLAFRCHWNWMKCRPTNFRWAIQINSVHWRFMKAQIKPINVKPEFQIQIMPTSIEMFECLWTKIIRNQIIHSQLPSKFHWFIADWWTITVCYDEANVMDSFWWNSSTHCKSSWERNREANNKRKKCQTVHFRRVLPTQSWSPLFAK